MIRVTFILIVAAVLQVFLSGPGFAHEFENSHIERSVDVVVRDRKVQVTYAIGLSDSTILDRLVENQLINAADEARFRKCIAEIEKASDAEQAKVAQSANEEVKSAKKNPAKTATAQTPKRGPKPSASESATAEEPLKFQTELLTLLQEKLSASIVEKLELNWNGNSLEKSEIEVSNSARHHVSLQIAFSVDLPDAEKNELEIVDRNFLELKTPPESSEPAADQKTAPTTDQGNVDDQELRYSGNIRMACRVKGKAIQVNSNVAPILARAKPTSVGPLDREQRIKAATIRTKLAFASEIKP